MMTLGKKQAKKRVITWDTKNMRYENNVKKRPSYIDPCDKKRHVLCMGPKLCFDHCHDKSHLDILSVFINIF